MRIAHISDTHLGYSQYRLTERKMDFFLSFERAVDLCIEKKVDLILHTGDLFESHQPDMLTLSRCAGTLKKARKAGIEIVAITGNHDRVLRRGTIPPQKFLEEMGLLTLIHLREDASPEELVLRMGGIAIAGFQYLPRRAVKVLKDILFPRLAEIAVKEDFSVFMFHQGIGQYLPYEESYELELSELPEGFNYYAGGHVHAFIKENVKGGILSYAGATEYRSSRDAEKGGRGFNIIETRTQKIERVEIEGLRPFGIFSVSRDTKKEDIERIKEFVETSSPPPVVVVKAFIPSADLDGIRKDLEEIKKRSLYVKLTHIENRKEEKAQPSAKTFSGLLEEFLKERGYPEKALKLGGEILSANPEDIKSLLKDFLKEELGERWKDIESIAEHTL